jgi:methylated-DNA-[protein]-cysteine S-methyltransferase
MQIHISELKSPLGTLSIATDERALLMLQFGVFATAMRRHIAGEFGGAQLQRDSDPLGIRNRLQRYLSGDLEALKAIPVRPGGTPFQKKVWNALLEIAPGQTASYRDIARRIRQPDATRAVGSANGRNPIAIVIPCHRVVASGGGLGGYSGGLNRKKWLLRHEGAPV